MVDEISARIAACATTRSLAAASLAAVLTEILATDQPVSEIALRDRWLERLRQEQTLYGDGWYMPPPHGMIVLFATDDNPGRIMSDNYRKPEVWPSNNVLLDRRNGLVMAYASPVDRATGIIGDFGIALYFGKKREVREHLAQCLMLDHEIANTAAIGMKLSAVARTADQLMTAHGWTNTVVSLNDPAKTNIGHTIPAVADGWINQEKAVFKGDDWETTKDMISRKRLFVSRAEGTVIRPDMAFTIEPRPHVQGRPDIPMVAYHTIMAFEHGRKRFLTDFDELFAIAGMDYMPTSPTLFS